MTNIEDLRIIFEDSLGSPGANERLQDGRYKFDYVEEEWQRFLSKQTAAAKLLAMAKEAGARSEHWATKLFPAVQFLFTPDELSRFAALVAAKERERLFGAGMQFDGQMRLQLTRWEDRQCFAAAAHFSAEQTHCGPDDLLTNAVERLEDSLDACIDAAIRARDRNQATGVVTGGVQ